MCVFIQPNQKLAELSLTNTSQVKQLSRHRYSNFSLHLVCMWEVNICNMQTIIIIINGVHTGLVVFWRSESNILAFHIWAREKKRFMRSRMYIKILVISCLNCCLISVEVSQYSKRIGLMMSKCTEEMLRHYNVVQRIIRRRINTLFYEPP